MWLSKLASFALLAFWPVMLRDACLTWAFQSKGRRSLFAAVLFRICRHRRPNSGYTWKASPLETVAGGWPHQRWCTLVARFLACFLALLLRPTHRFAVVQTTPPAMPPWAPERAESSLRNCFVSRMPRWPTATAASKLYRPSVVTDVLLLKLNLRTWLVM